MALVSREENGTSFEIKFRSLFIQQIKIIWLLLAGHIRTKDELKYKEYEYEINYLVLTLPYTQDDKI